jgi:hypothetical protein
MTKIRDCKPQKHKKYMIQFGYAKLKYTFIDELFCKIKNRTEYVFVAENEVGYSMATLFDELTNIEEVKDDVD